ncbi:beta-N-acetylglucosaminidase [Streptomyces sp. CNQ-509]|uniref:beta-N-acetylhexosaminidase n=1 Tax=unclassified Streptomyces TaxID=2593676 RepID=UPI00062E0052|nr:glycoside hydrolase family 20 protein [Streptomyces sp. CNQ-509]AKH84423.1 beta-N-acetylglucosaminidase [Streptomyces sp. CNQ-509]
MRFPPRPSRPPRRSPAGRHAHRPGGPLRALRGPRRALYWAVATVLATAAVLLALRPVLDGGDGDGTPRSGVGAAAHRTGQGQAPATPTPGGEDFPAPPRGDRGTPLPDPRTVPAVRSYERADGTGWRPADRAVVIAEDDALTDESMRLAAELGMLYAKAPGGDGPPDSGQRGGDIRLRLDPGRAGGPEAYRIDVADGRATVTAATDTGVFYGTRTLLQAARAGGGVPPGRIDDRPDRRQRGFMVDIARKHFSAAWLSDRLREMADLKLNQLHLHLSDDQAFRIESDSHPEVVSDPHLTKAQVRDILDLAADLHITVIPEIDSPGHLGAVLDAHPDLQLKTPEGSPVEGAIDISEPRAARIVDDLLTEYARLFPGPYVHIGGDEYVALMASDPEARYPDLAAAARERFGAGAAVADLNAAWLNERADTVRERGKKVKAWNDGFIPGAKVSPDRDREVEYWTGKEAFARDPQAFLEDGWRLVNLNDEYLYYVLGEPNDFTYPTGKRIYEEWTPAVLRGTRPVPERLAGPGKVLGARFAVWGDRAGAQTPEQVAEGVRLPLAALAQKVWDPREPRLGWGEFADLAGTVRGRG